MTEKVREKLFRWIMESEWLDVDAVICETSPDFLVDVVFKTLNGVVSLSGTDQYLADGTDAFNLDIRPWPEGGRWKKGSGPSFLTLRNIRKELADGLLAPILTPPRSVRFFKNPRFAMRVSPSGESLLRDCAAIEFSKVINGRTLMMVLQASDNFPCDIEIGTTPESCSSLLQGLVPYDVLQGGRKGGS
jgi:hypothetical protein